MVVVRGNLAYRERIALPPDSIAELRIIEVPANALPGAPGIARLAGQSIPLKGAQVPIPFTLQLERAQLKPNAQYLLQSVLHDGQNQMVWQGEVTLPPLNAAQIDLGMLLLLRTEAPTPTMPGAQSPISTTFQCGDTRVETSFQDDRMRLRFEGQEFTLPQAVSASGAKYESETRHGVVTFWNKGKEAMFKVGQHEYPKCVEITSQQAGATKADYRAVGNEPGWNAEISGNRLMLKLDYDQKRLNLPLPPVQAMSNGQRYVVRAPGQDIVLNIVNRSCNDSMSGASFPDTVTLKVNGQTLNGCGGAPAKRIVGTEWVVEDVGGAGIIDSSRLTLKMDEEGRIGGESGCNVFNGSYQLQDEQLKIDHLATSMRACAPALMKQESRFLRLLNQVQHATINHEGALVLKTQSGNVIVARR